jgi:hypothetical protein
MSIKSISDAYLKMLNEGVKVEVEDEDDTDVDTDKKGSTEKKKEDPAASKPADDAEAPKDEKEPPKKKKALDDVEEACGSKKMKKEASGDKEAYQKFFQAALKKYGVKSPSQLDGDKEKSFYDYIDKNWKSDDETNEARKYKAPTKAEIEADKKKDAKGKSRSSMTAKSASKSVYKNMMGQMKEEVELEEGKNHLAADELNAYAKKYGGIDKKDFQVAAGKLDNYKATGNPGAISDLVKMLKDLDTDPMEKILVTIKKHDKAMAKSLEKKMGIRIRESVELTEAPEDMEPASPDEKSMAMKQAEFLAYVGREVMEHLESNKEFPEWMQNKLSKLHGQAESLHSSLGDHGKDSMDESLAVVSESVEINEDHFKVGDKVKCKASGMSGEVTKVGDGEGAYYTVKRDDGSTKQYEPSELVKEGVELEEAKFTDKQIKQAYGVINDKRWKGGNMTHIVKTIEKIARGLSKHPGVVKALKATNEEKSYKSATLTSLVSELKNKGE